MEFKIVQIISEHKKKARKNPPKSGYKRVEAIVEYKGGFRETKHVDIPINKI